MRTLLLCAYCALVLDAQTPNLKKRPRMGLALEGGAALGFAHIGVLEWLEANRIPVDMVAGTSMRVLCAMRLIQSWYAAPGSFYPWSGT